MMHPTRGAVQPRLEARPGLARQNQVGATSTSNTSGCATTCHMAEDADITKAVGPANRPALARPARAQMESVDETDVAKRAKVVTPILAEAVKAVDVALPDTPSDSGSSRKQPKNTVAMGLNELGGVDDVEVGWCAGDLDVVGRDGDVQMVGGSGDRRECIRVTIDSGAV